MMEVGIRAELTRTLVSAKPKETSNVPRTQKTPAPETKSKAHRIARSASKKRIGIPAPAPIQEFDVAGYHDEIAEVAYLKWLERSGSPEEDWLKAESEVRARYAQLGA
jgi:hypothetical protein